MQEIDQPISWDKLKATVTKLTNNKAPWIKEVPPNYFKSINDNNLTDILNFFNKYWQEETYFDEWYEDQIVPLPKIGDLSDPKKCCGVTLTDIRAKIFSSILCGRAFNIINTYGAKYRFGYTPGVGWQDGSFTLKTLINLWHNNNLPSLVAFADMLKAFDTSKHKLLISILSIYGAPPRFFSTIRII